MMGGTVTEYPKWFAGAEHNFFTHLKNYKGQPDLKFLQIGVFTGDASVWLLENILTDLSSTLTDVDTWEGSPDEEVHAEMDFNDVYETYKKKVKFYTNVRSVRTTSAEFFKVQKPNTYDFVYIDGDHTAKGVYEDAEGAWACLLPGGIIGFDDYKWGDSLENQELAPRPGIDRFMQEHVGQYTTLNIDYQVWIQKL